MIFLAKMSNLTLLDVSWNKLNGTLPESIGNLSNLDLLRVSRNNFTGVLSEAHLGKLSKLKHLDLSLTYLTLKLAPNWVPAFNQLQTLILRSCTIGQQFPSWLQNQSSLTFLDLSNSGIVSNAIPNFFSKSNFQVILLNLSFNHVKTTLPNIPLNNINPFIDLSSNRFHGSIPLSLFKGSMLNLSNNSLTAFGPLFCTILDGKI